MKKKPVIFTLILIFTVSLNILFGQVTDAEKTLRTQRKRAVYLLLT
jgi:hypothetical protein